MEIVKWFNDIIFYKDFKKTYWYDAKTYHCINETAAKTWCLKINHKFSTMKTIKS